MEFDKQSKLGPNMVVIIEYLMCILQLFVNIICGEARSIIRLLYEGEVRKLGVSQINSIARATDL
jgi:hypothetical protein